jgi:dTDP-4-amino-4,6-dideoxygalactose transaminase
MSYYKKEYGLNPEDFPVALEAFETCISLPLYPGLSDEQVDYIVRTVVEIGKDRYRG